ncbi:uncharacterized protein [Watersipora subatra]|uniref:uncharacterized protein n=1 Tax=Watersipora subatra TaxID=2589382 RepID=UPI00355BE0BA
MSRRPRRAGDLFFIQRDRVNLSRKVPFFLLGVTVLLSMNILLLLQQQPNTDGLPVVQTNFLDSRKLRQYIEPSSYKTFPVKIPLHEEIAPKQKRSTTTTARPINVHKRIMAERELEPAKQLVRQTTTVRSEQPTTRISAIKPGSVGRGMHILKAPPKISNQQNMIAVYGKSPPNTMPPLKDGAYITPNEILQRTAVAIKTFNRAECLLLTVASFKQNYPDIPIFVADDSFQDTVSKNLTEHFNVTYIRLPVDSGVGYGRNRLVEHIYKLGYQYMIMSDDDYTIGQQDLLLMMAEHLIATEAHAIAPLRCDYGHCERSKGMIHMGKEGDLTVYPNMTFYPDEKVPTCHRSDLMQQFFITKTETLHNVHWDDTLKNNDHYDFLFNSKMNNLRLVTCTDIKVLHNKKICQDKVTPELMENYLKVRGERWLNLTSYVFAKWGIRTLYDETGKTISLDKATGRPDIAPVQRVVVNATNPFRSYFEQAILDHHNDNNPGWYNLRIVPKSRKTYIVYKRLNKCTYWLGGKLDVDYDRHSSFPNKNQVLSFDFHHLNRSCSDAEDFLTLRNFGKLDKRHVYFVTAVSNDPIHMDRLLDLVNNQTNRQHVTFVIVDMGKDDEKYDYAERKASVDIKYLYLGGPFSRSIGLKRGFDYAKQIASERGQEDAIGFSIDTSIIIPNNFSDIIRSHVRCGVSSYAPVCYKHKDPGGYWVITGYGMIGACFDDYDAIGGWDTRWGYRWGAEDVDIMNRMLKRLQLTVRTEEDNFEHLHTGSSRSTYKLYYKNKNLYDGDLPITPLTKKLTDEAMAKRLYDWVRPQMKYPISLTDGLIYFTHNPQTDTNMYDVRFQNGKGEEYYAIVESLL